MKILYFSWIKDKVGKSEEYIDLDTEINNVNRLITFLKQRNSIYDEVFKDTSSIRVSINMETAKLDDKIKQGDEIAFFPPMTGG